MYKKGAQMVFVDSTGSVDSHDLVVTLFVIAANCGVLPVGITIAGEKLEHMYTEAIRMLNAVTVDVDVASSLQLEIEMIDHDEALRHSLSTVWPRVSLLLFLFHVLQVVWRYLFTASRSVSKENWHLIFQKF